MSDSTDRPRVAAPPPLFYAVGFLAGLLLERLVPSELWHALPVPAVGTGLIALGLALVLWAGATFARHRTSVMPHRPATTVVESGPYRFTRNPIYLGMLLIYVGGVAWAGRLGPLVMLPLVILALQPLVIAREEHYLLTKFGEQYQRYRDRVRRWI
jgi:protein-S-isoprenylcysteine O-methyltransferase Ste14